VPLELEMAMRFKTDPSYHGCLGQPPATRTTHYHQARLCELFDHVHGCVELSRHGPRRNDRLVGKWNFNGAVCGQSFAEVSDGERWHNFGRGIDDDYADSFERLAFRGIAAAISQHDGARVTHLLAGR